MARVTITYEDRISLTPEEIIANVKQAYGVNTQVEVRPLNDSPESYVYFGIQNIITKEQAEAFFDSEYMYPEKLKLLRKEVLKKVTFILNKVIIDNEERFTEED